MKIYSEQEMLDFGASFADKLINDQNITLQGHTQSTKNKTNKIVHTATGANTRTEKGNLQSSIVIELIGDVGAGKTTFVRGFAKGLGIKKSITSPSFTISKVYALQNGDNLIHYDFYRLENPGLMSADFTENLENPNNIIIVEWANNISGFLPANRFQISINKNDDNTRTIQIAHQESKDATNPKQNHKNYPPTSNSRKTHQHPLTTLQLYLDTSTPTTILKLNDKTYQWHSDRDLAEKLLQFIHNKLQENYKDWQDISQITFMSGPGSFTGLRIGATIVNTLAHELNVPLYNHRGEKVKLILPDYGHDANISKPRK